MDMISCHDLTVNAENKNHSKQYIKNKMTQEGLQAHLLNQAFEYDVNSCAVSMPIDFSRVSTKKYQRPV